MLMSDKIESWKSSMSSLILSSWDQISLIAYKLDYKDPLILFANKFKK